MAINTSDKAKIVSDYQRAQGDTGSPEVQVALLTARINDLDIAVLETHLRACRPSEPLANAPVMLGEVIRRVRVEALKV